MSDIKILNTGKTWAHASVGTLKSFEGKQFVKEATGADSCEISFGSLPSGAAVPFFHATRPTRRTISSSQVPENFR